MTTTKETHTMDIHEMLTMIIELHNMGLRKIQTIKIVRASGRVYGVDLGLKDSKDLVDAAHALYSAPGLSNLHRSYCPIGTFTLDLLLRVARAGAGVRTIENLAQDLGLTGPSRADICASITAVARLQEAAQGA